MRYVKCKECRGDNEFVCEHKIRCGVDEAAEIFANKLVRDEEIFKFTMEDKMAVNVITGEEVRYVEVTYYTRIPEGLNEI